MFKRSLVAALALTVAAVGAARAQTSSRTVESTPFVIHAAPVAADERRAKAGEPLLVQPVTSVRAAKLLAEAPTTSGYKKVKAFPAGTALFGAYAPDGWAYCAVAASTARWWAGDEFACYQDGDDDGRFDHVRLSGAPFMGVPLFVFELGAPKPLPTPVPYQRTAYGEGPRIDYALGVQVMRPKTKRDQPPAPATAVRLTASIGQEGRYAKIGDEAMLARLDGGQTATLEFRGAKISVLGVEPDGAVRYRVDTPMPTHVDRVVMGITTTTTYTPIFIPG